MKINAQDPLKAHSTIGAQGWELDTLLLGKSVPAEHPQNAIGLYHRGEAYAYLFQHAEGGFELLGVTRCEFCKQLADCREFHRQTNPQSGDWCEACFHRWRAEVTFQPMSFGGMLATGWDEEHDDDDEAA